MDAVVNLVIIAGVFCLGSLLIWYFCVKFGLPAPALWICGGILILLVFIFLGRLVTGAGIPQFYHSALRAILNA